MCTLLVRRSHRDISSDSGRALASDPIDVAPTRAAARVLVDFLRTRVRKKFTRTIRGGGGRGGEFTSWQHCRVFRSRGQAVPSGAVDELLDDDGAPRPVARGLMQLLDQLGVDELRERQRMSDVEILTMGISFTIYS